MSLPNAEGQQQHEQLDSVCSLCQNPPDKNMTSCSDCHNIFHKICVNVTDDDITFKCLQCSAIRPNSPAPSATSSRLSQSRKIDLQLQRLEEERKLNKEYLDKKYQLLEEAEALTDVLSNNSQSVHEWLATSEPNLENNKQHTTESTSNTKNLQTTSLPNQTHYLNDPYHVPTTVAAYQNQPTMPHNYVQYVPPMVTSAAMNSFTTSTVPNCTTIPTYSGFQQRMQLPRPPVIAYPPGTILTSFSTNNNPQNLFNSAQQTFIQRQPISSTTNLNTNAPINAATGPLPNLAPQQKLQQNQINSRHSLPKELPIFSGQPEEWPIFISTYEWSTAACAFTDAENLIRLQKALQGEALHSVQQMLIHPDNVPDVLQVLRMLYGQPLWPLKYAAYYQQLVQVICMMKSIIHHFSLI